MKVIKAEDTRSLEPFRDQIIEGDCLEVMKGIPGESIDMILCDLPYGTTQNKWDSIIDAKRVPFSPALPWSVLSRGPT